MEVLKVEKKQFNIRGRHQARLKAETNEVSPDLVNFYTTPPDHSISLEEFESYAVERLRLLKQIEAINCRKDLNRHSNDYYYDVCRAISNNKDLSSYDTLLKGNGDAETMELVHKRDHVSHFLLRLAFSRTDEQRKWFLALETDFLRIKLARLNTLEKVIENHHLPYEKIEDDERKKCLNDVLLASFSHAPTTIPRDVYKTDFKNALDLVRTRKVYLSRGKAYIPVNDLQSVIAVKFRTYLSECLSLLKKNIHVVDEDERLRPLLFGFEKRYLGSDRNNSMKSGDVISCSQLETFSGKSFPLCMKNLFDVVNKDHHLKHWGRLQLGLFFKGIGLPMDEAIKYWRSNFTKKPDIDSNRFDKQYLYNIKHMYGQEGRRTDYTPYSCLKIIHSNVGPGDHHGCPFRHSDATPLRVKLIDAGISQDGVKEVMKLVDERQYQLACQRYFELTHDQLTIDGGVHHPNQYFKESRDVLTGKRTIKTEVKEVKPAPTKMYSKSQTSTQTSTKEIEQMDLSDDELLSSISMDVSY